MGGAASSWVMARPFLRARYKEAGVYLYWTGDKDTVFFRKQTYPKLHVRLYLRSRSSQARFRDGKGCDRLVQRTGCSKREASTGSNSEQHIQDLEVRGVCDDSRALPDRPRRRHRASVWPDIRTNSKQNQRLHTVCFVIKL
jgi:hypothetical protein